MRLIVFFLPLLLLSFLYLVAGKKPVAGTRLLTLAHNLDVSHPVHKALEKFKQQVEEVSESEVKVAIYPNGQLGSEREVIELLQLGAVTMTKVSSLSLESFVPAYAVLNLPYIFRDRDHFFKVLDSSTGELLHQQGRAKKFLGLTYYDSGARSFYSDHPINHPDDLQGLKIRVMNSQTAIKMLQLLGGSPTPMPYGEIYTALQQKVIDGAENNISALVLSRHGEAVSYYSLDEHIMAPDVVIISDGTWNNLDGNLQTILKEAAQKSSHLQRKLWQELNTKLLSEIKLQFGIKVVRPNKQPFIDKVSPIHDQLSNQNPLFSDLIKSIKSL